MSSLNTSTADLAARWKLRRSGRELSQAAAGTRADVGNQVARPYEEKGDGGGCKTSSSSDLSKNVGPMGPTGPRDVKALNNKEDLNIRRGTHGRDHVGPTGPIIDFAAINAAALRVLPHLLARWLPDGRAQGHEWTARNPRRADRNAGSFKVNIRTGKWADFATGDAGGDPISLVAYLFGLRQIEAAAKMAEMLGVARQGGAA